MAIECRHASRAELTDPAVERLLRAYRVPLSMVFRAFALVGNPSRRPTTFDELGAHASAMDRRAWTSFVRDVLERALEGERMRLATQQALRVASGQLFGFVKSRTSETLSYADFCLALCHLAATLEPEMGLALALGRLIGRMRAHASSRGSSPRFVAASAGEQQWEAAAAAERESELASPARQPSSARSTPRSRPLTTPGSAGPSPHSASGLPPRCAASGLLRVRTPPRAGEGYEAYMRSRHPQAHALRGTELTPPRALFESEPATPSLQYATPRPYATLRASSASSSSLAPASRPGPGAAHASPRPEPAAARPTPAGAGPDGTTSKVRAERESTHTTHAVTNVT
jgi:hypothetical protein